MTPKRRCVRMDMDDLAWEQSDNQYDEWQKSLHKTATYREIAGFINKHRPGKAVELHKPIKGGYNAFYRLEYDDGSSAAMRIPSPGMFIPPQTMSQAPLVKFPDEKTPKISDQKLRYLYRQIANIVLYLSTLSFAQIWSLVQDEKGLFSISRRPLMQNMNSTVEITDSPASLLPAHVTSSKEWYSAMADMHLLQLTFQHNNAVEGEHDACDKYVARQLFQKLASDRRLTTGFGSQASEGDEPTFRLFSEDLRPSNVLVDKDLRVVGVINWEFTYAAPAEFAFDPPWWLLLKLPEYWPGGYEDWMKVYEPRFATFIATARNIWAFDFLFWRYLDPRYFDDNEDGHHRARLPLLSQKQLNAMEPFVRLKMEQRKEKIRVQWGDEDAKAELDKVML